MPQPDLLTKASSLLCLVRIVLAWVDYSFIDVMPMPVKEALEILRATSESLRRELAIVLESLNFI
ncbi:hypothetical protein DSUL_20554 [Desulfovibrionales bacterium]